MVMLSPWVGSLVWRGGQWDRTLPPAPTDSHNHRLNHYNPQRRLPPSAHPLRHPAMVTIAQTPSTPTDNRHHRPTPCNSSQPPAMVATYFTIAPPPYNPRRWSAADPTSHPTPGDAPTSAPVPRQHSHFCPLPPVPRRHSHFRHLPPVPGLSSHYRHRPQSPGDAPTHICYSIYLRISNHIFEPPCSCLPFNLSINHIFITVHDTKYSGYCLYHWLPFIINNMKILFT